LLITGRSFICIAGASIPCEDGTLPGENAQKQALQWSFFNINSRLTCRTGTSACHEQQTK
jgi:hypothetical protein